MSFGSLLNNHLRTPFYGFEDLLNTKFESEVYMEGLANEGMMGAVCEIAIEFEGVIRDFQGSSLASYPGPLLECSANEAKLHALWRGVKELESSSSRRLFGR